MYQLHSQNFLKFPFVEGGFDTFTCFKVAWVKLLKNNAVDITRSIKPDITYKYF